jgi:O-antigen/teichoic acid export membrane protein
VALGRTRTGVLGITTLGTLVIRTISSMTLTRLLRPEDFGIVGIIGSVFYTIGMFTDLGFQAFLIRHERTEERHFRDVIWTLHAKRGVALFMLVVVASPLISRLLGKPALTLPLAVASTTFAIHGFTSMAFVAAARYDKARELSLLDFGLQVFQTCAAISLALWLRNAWAMIGAMVLLEAMRTIMSYRLFDNSAQRPARDPDVVREFLTFSRLILASSIITLLLAQTDKFVLARLFTLHEFGLYALALSITSAPAMFASSFLSRVVFPIYAATWRERPAALGNVYYDARSRQSALYAFACGGLIGSASLVVAILYDPRYAPAATYISLLMISVALQMPNLAAMQLMMATGHLKALVHTNIARLLWLAVGIPVGFYLGGTLGIVAAVGLIEVPALIFNWVLLRKQGVLDLRHELSSLVLIPTGAAIGYFTAHVALMLVPHI